MPNDYSVIYRHKFIAVGHEFEEANRVFLILQLYVNLHTFPCPPPIRNGQQLFIARQTLQQDILQRVQAVYRSFSAFPRSFVRVTRAGQECLSRLGAPTTTATRPLALDARFVTLTGKLSAALFPLNVLFLHRWVVLILPNTYKSAQWSWSRTWRTDSISKKSTPRLKSRKSGRLRRSCPGMASSKRSAVILWWADRLTLYLDVSWCPESLSLLDLWPYENCVNGRLHFFLASAFISFL